MLCLLACGGGNSSAATAAGAAGSGGGALPSCDAVCPGVLSAKCSHGPVSQSDCVSGCQSVRASKCAAQYDALYQCGGATPRYACDSGGQVILAGCDSAAAMLYACVAKP
jgi:hypothetical protein